MSLVSLLVRVSCLTAFLSCAPRAEAVVYATGFSDVTVSNKPNGYLGGWFGSHVAFGEWVGQTSLVQVSGGKLVATSDTHGYRGAALVLDPSLFPGAGRYRLGYDLESISGSAGDSASASIWYANGYDLFSSPNANIIDTLNHQVVALGTANSGIWGLAVHTTSALNQQIEFTYDGFSAVVIMLGANDTGSWPFSTATFDNISVSKLIPTGRVVPEPTNALVGVLIGIAILQRRVVRG